MVAFQDVQHLLLRVLTGKPADTLGQGGCGVESDNAQTFLQWSKGSLGIVACFLQRFVKAPVELDGAEQRSDAAPVDALVVFPRVIQAIPLHVLGSILRKFRLDVVENRLNDLSSTFVKQQTQSVLEVHRGCGIAGFREITSGEGRDLLVEAKARLGRLLNKRWHLLKNSLGHGKSPNA